MEALWNSWSHLLPRGEYETQQYYNINNIINIITTAHTVDMYILQHSIINLQCNDFGYKFLDNSEVRGLH